MKYYRYGKFRFSDHYEYWFIIVFFLFLSLSCILLDLSLVLTAFPLILAAVLLWSILSPQCEQFVLCNNAISVLRGKKTHTIHLPPELTLVVSYADICSPFAIPTAPIKKIPILRDKFAVSILQKMPVDTVLERLHRIYIEKYKYTTSSIQVSFDDYRYIYCFVCNQSLLDELITNHKCLLIIPESLLGVVSVDPNTADVYVDKGC